VLAQLVFKRRHHFASLTKQLFPGGIETGQGITDLDQQILEPQEINFELLVVYNRINGTIKVARLDRLSGPERWDRVFAVRRKKCRTAKAQNPLASNVLPAGFAWFSIRTVRRIIKVRHDAIVRLHFVGRWIHTPVYPLDWGRTTRRLRGGSLVRPVSSTADLYEGRAWPCHAYRSGLDRSLDSARRHDLRYPYADGRFNFSYWPAAGKETA
jgi:hypothetical protein